MQLPGEGACVVTFATLSPCIRRNLGTEFRYLLVCGCSSWDFDAPDPARSRSVNFPARRRRDFRGGNATPPSGDSREPRICSAGFSDCRPMRTTALYVTQTTACHLSRLSSMLRLSPSGKSMRKPAPRCNPSGTSASSKWRNSEAEIRAWEKIM